MGKTLRAWRVARQGQAVVEYALIIVLIALVLFFAVKYFGLGVQHSLNNTALRVKKS
jgi:Flp pilus assembly pilin Flp